MSKVDLWVRSQDRRALYKTSGFFIKEEQYKRKGKYIIEGNECWLGAYNTFERALEVLDEIQKLLTPKMIIKNEGRDCVALDGTIYRTNIVSNINSDIQQLSTYVYEMPKE